jgi:hypothetical protein
VAVQLSSCTQAEKAQAGTGGQGLRSNPEGARPCRRPRLVLGFSGQMTAEQPRKGSRAGAGMREAAGGAPSPANWPRAPRSPQRGRRGGGAQGRTPQRRNAHSQRRAAGQAPYRRVSPAALGGGEGEAVGPPPPPHPQRRTRRRLQGARGAAERPPARRSRASGLHCTSSGGRRRCRRGGRERRGRSRCAAASEPPSGSVRGELRSSEGAAAPRSGASAASGAEAGSRGGSPYT